MQLITVLDNIVIQSNCHQVMLHTLFSLSTELPPHVALYSPMANTNKDRDAKSHALDALLFDLQIETCPTAEGKGKYITRIKQFCEFLSEFN